MNNDLKIIKKKYGEKMMHFCRDLFPTILEIEGLLPKLLMDNFNENHYLYDDIVKNEMQLEFKNFIFNLVIKDDKREIHINRTPEELMDEAGYVLKECLTEEEIQEYTKYYIDNESLCTFRNMELYGFSRLHTNRVFFAIRKDVDKINRNDFLLPRREDDYGTSVLSIQFSRDETHSVSIISRYNHSVYNPNATYSNNLDEIIPGLTDSFAKYKDLQQKCPTDEFGLEGYVKAKNGKMYKYNYEVDGIYYCPDNLVIKLGIPKQYDKSRYLVLDYFILDLKEKDIINSDTLCDGFTRCISKIDKITIENVDNNKRVTITGDNDKSMVIELDEFNRIIKLSMRNIRNIENNFLHYNRDLRELDAKDIVMVFDQFLMCNKGIKSLKLDNLISVGNSFMYANEVLEECSFNELQRVGSWFLGYNKSLKDLELPNLELTGSDFMEYNENLESIKLDKLRRIHHNFLYHNKKLKELYIQNVEEISNYCLQCCDGLKDLVLPKVKTIGTSFLYSAKDIERFYAPNLETLSNYSLNCAKKIGSMYTPNLRQVGTNVLFSLEDIKKYDFSSLEEYPNTFMYEYENRQYVLGGINENRTSSK